jgi:hypothetical protein
MYTPRRVIRALSNASIFTPVDDLKSNSARRVECKEDLDNETCVLVSDFSENFSFVIQDCHQGFY